MSDMAIFRGSKGGGGSFRQTPDNLRSNDTFEGVLGVGIGPMKGPTKGLKSVKIDGTAIENATGQLNFGDFLCNIGDGDPMSWPQTISLKLGAGGAPTNVGLSLTNPGNTDPGPWVVKTLNNTGADYIDLRFIVNQLFRQDKKGIYEETATIEIEMKPVGRTQWIAPEMNNPGGSYNQDGVVNGSTKTFIPRAFFNSLGNWTAPTKGYRVKGKTSSPAVYELRINVPNEGPYANTAWDVRARLVERESYQGGTDNVDQEKRTITWESMAAVYAGNLGTHEDWRGVAWMQLYGKASDQLTGVPEVTGEWDTKIVSVPPATLYNPASRQYVAGTWDGSFSKAFTTDPSWIINDAITDSLSGLSLIAQGSYLNKWDALEASKWFSELVPNGDGGWEPRYSLNLSINQPQKAEEFIRYLAGAVGSLAWDQGNGEWRLKCDKPDVPVDLFTLENIEGEFVYSHTDVDTRFNDITIAFKNKEMDYREDRVRLYDNASIALIGRKPTTIVGVGCTGRQEAMRRAKLRLASTTGEVKIVNFSTNRRGRNIDHLDLILVADADLGAREAKTTGRCVEISADRKTITLRDPVYLAPGIGYTIRFSSPNPAYVPAPTVHPPEQWKKPTLAGMRTVVNPNDQRGSRTVIMLDTALPANVDMNLTVALEAINLPTAPKLYRVTNVVLDDDGERISLSALEVNIAKWAQADNVSKLDTIFQDLRGAVPPPLPPEAGTMLSVARVPIEQGFQTNLVVNWKRPPGAFINGFQVSYSINGGARKIAVENLQQSTYEFVNPVAGRYDIEVRTMDRRGGLSAALAATTELSQDQLTAGDIKYDDENTVEYYKPAEPGATKGAPEGTEIAGRPVEEVLQDFDIDVLNLAAEELRGATWRATRDDAITYPDGRTVRQVTEQLGAAVGQHTAYITEQKTVSTDGTAKAVLQVRGDNVITGFTAQSDGRTGSFYILADEFGVVDPNNGDPTKPFYIVDGIVYMNSVRVQSLDIGAVKTTNIDFNQVTAKRRWSVSFGTSGVEGKYLGNPGEGTWNDFGNAGDKAFVAYDDVEAGSELCVRWYVNLRRSGSNDDRVRFRLRRVQPGGGVSYVGDQLQVGMSDEPDVISYEWNDLVSVSGAYSYHLEYMCVKDDGIYYSAKMILDLGQR